MAMHSGCYNTFSRGSLYNTRMGLVIESALWGTEILVDMEFWLRFGLSGVLEKNYSSVYCHHLLYTGVFWRLVGMHCTRVYNS